MMHRLFGRRQVFVAAVLFSLFLAAMAQTVNAQADSEPTVAVVPSQNTAQIGESLTVNITLTNVENLYGLDIAFSWNSSVLQLIDSQALLGVETYPEGVLHEPVLIIVEDVSQETGQYQLVAISQATAQPFSGSGTIATFTFNVTSTGHTTLTVQSTLADYPEPDQVSEPIAHARINATINAVIPEFPSTIILAALIAAVTATLLLHKQHQTKKATHT
ncbi:MAG: cohesin domain-containing protein [Candidatus Bathyarchaeota archaeon]|nr:cohesin domain-containing protein [Candidatus Bathyarchaeota archaeon]